MQTRIASIKAITDDTVTIAGYGVVFGGEDVTGDVFDVKTDFWLDRMPGQRPVLFEHSFDDALGLKSLGNATIEQRDDGLWVEAQLARHERYMEQVLQLAERDALGWSSGSVSHLVRREGKSITSWPIVEFSLTTTPAEPRTLGVRELRSLADVAPAVKALLPEEPADQSADSASATVGVAMVGVGNEHKTEDTMEINLDEMAAKAAELIWAKLAAENPAKTGGFMTAQAAAESLEGTKSFGDFLVAVKRHDVKRLSTVYAVKDLAEGAGATGGYLVPHEFVAQLLQVAEENAVVRSRAYRHPMTTRSTTIPMLNQTKQPTAGDPSWFGGVHFHWTEEGGTKTETEPVFKQLELVAHELAGYTQASNAIAADSAISIDSLLRQLFGRAIGWMEDYVFLRGNGVGKPLGVLNAPALLTVTRAGASHAALADFANMLGIFVPSSMGRAMWVCNQTVLPDLVQLKDSSNRVVWIPNAASSIPATIFGIPVVFTEKLPALGTEGDVLLADFSYYVIGDRQQMQVDFSEHFAFTSNTGTWRVSERIDGQPWLDAPIYLTDASTKISPFVVLK